MRLVWLIKNPIFAIGLLMMVIFLWQINQKSWMAKLTPSSCQAVLVKLNRKIPATWKTHCEGSTFNNLAITIKVVNEFSQKEQLLAYLYREMANHLIHVARNSPEDNLERTHIVRLKLLHPQMEINALSEGKWVVKLATLADKHLITEHLKATVSVQERPLTESQPVAPPR